MGVDVAGAVDLVKLKNGMMIIAPIVMAHIAVTEACVAVVKALEKLLAFNVTVRRK